MKAALGIDIGGTTIRAGLLRADGSMDQIKEISTEAGRGGQHVVSRVISLIQQYEHAELIGIGIGTAGQVDFAGTILSGTKTIPGWAGISLAETIQEAFQLPVRVVNDVQAMALGELHFGEGRGVQHFLSLALGTGVGGAIVLNGRLYRGASGAAGEMGHMVIREGGRSCPCGKKGCLEAYASGVSLSQQYAERTGRAVSGSDLMQLVREGDVHATEVMSRYIDDLACGIASLATIFNPEKIVLNGGVSEGLTPFLSILTEKVEAQLSQAIKNTFQLSISSLGGKAMLLGAASLNEFEHA